MRAVHGNRVGAKRKAFYACLRCGSGIPAVKGIPKPASCPGSCQSDHVGYFASQAELVRYNELLILQRSGEIKDLACQPEFTLLVVDPDGRAQKVGTYVGDFIYREAVSLKTKPYTAPAGSYGPVVVEDVKGRRDTVLSQWKRKHAEVQYGFRVRIVQR